MGIIGNSIFIILCKGDYGLNWKRYKTPSDGWSAYIESNKRSAAIPNNGIAALLFSTSLYIFAAVAANYSVILTVYGFVFTQIRFLFFHPKLDKPSRRGCSGCRSPPVLHFRLSRITKMEDKKVAIHTIFGCSTWRRNNKGIWIKRIRV